MNKNIFSNLLLKDPYEELRAGKRLGKYKLHRRLGGGGFSDVFSATDTIEGIKVALKIPHINPRQAEIYEEIKAEVRINAKLNHPNILQLKNADIQNGIFVMAYPLGWGSLSDRIKVRISTQNCWNYSEQILEALAFAHSKRIIHCDVKPENFILFPNEDFLRLGDFGIAKVSFRTISTASGSGTIGYVAPEQAMGKPSFRSDVFSAGLLLYRMFSGALPKWPFHHPLPNLDKLRRKTDRKFVSFLLKAIQLDERKRFRNACHMLEEFKGLSSQPTARKRRKQSIAAG